MTGVTCTRCGRSIETRVGIYDRQGRRICNGCCYGPLRTEEYRRIGADERNGVRVSTVWLGLDHQFGSGPPLIFETMVFGGEHDQRTWRYSTEAEAKAGHAEACALALGAS